MYKVKYTPSRFSSQIIELHLSLVHKEQFLKFGNLMNEITLISLLNI